MNTDRLGLYRTLEEQIGNTPLVRYGRDVPNNNVLYIKQEFMNGFGESHYSRVYRTLFRNFEEHRGLKQGDHVLETSSGTAALAFLEVGNHLGFHCHVAIPEGVDQVVLDMAAEKVHRLYLTPEKDYVNGFPTFLKRFLPRNKDIVFLNHSMDRSKGGCAYSCNEVTLSALKGIVDEVAIDIDYFMPAVGNGSSILGGALSFGDSGTLHNPTKIVAFESFQSAVLYDLLHPGRYVEEFGIEPGVLPRHTLRGTSFQGIAFPHIHRVADSGFVSDSILVSDSDVDSNYTTVTGRTDSELLPHWDVVEPEGYGRSTRAGIAAALRFAEKVEGKNILIIGYDRANRYDF